MNGNKYFTSSIYRWLSTSLERNDFCDLLPIFEGTENELQNKKKDYAKIFSNASNPPQNIVQNQQNSSQLLDFIQFLFDNNYRNYIFCYFVQFLPRDQMTYFLALNIKCSTIPETELSFILQKLPVCDYVVLLHCQRLQKPTTFLLSIAFLFRYIGQLSEDIEKLVAKSFRQSLQKKIGLNLLHEMLSILFATESGPKPFDLFFTAFHDSHSILLEYTQSCDLDSLFASFPQREDLPISFLKFLVKTMTVYYFPESLIIQYSIQCSELFFRYISQITDECELSRIWTLLLTSIEFYSSFSAASIGFSKRSKNDLIRSGWNYILNMTPSMRIHVIHNIMHSYLFFIERFHSLLILCDDRSFKTFLLSFLSLNIEKTCTSNNYLAVVLNIFLIARSNEVIASFISSNFGLNEYFLQILTNSCNEKDFSFNTRIVDALLFILFPFNQYIFSDIYPQISNFILMMFISSPCNTFCKQIASSILTILFDLKSKDSNDNNLIKGEINGKIFDYVIDFLLKMSKRIEFQKICSVIFENEEFLLKVTKLCLNEGITIKNEHYYNFIICCLSYSCNFSVFYYIYSRFQSDIQKTIHFFRQIVEQTPIVNSFFTPSEALEVKIPLLQTTTVLWFRVMNSQTMTINTEKEETAIETADSKILFSRFPTKIISIPISNENKYIIMLNRETFYVFEEKTNKVVGKVKSVVNIENWNLLTLGIDSKSINITLNMQKIMVKFNSSVSNIDSMTIHPSFDIQLMKIYQKNLKFSQILQIFAIGPNSKDNLIDNFISIAKSSSIIVNPAASNNYSTLSNPVKIDNQHLFSNRGYISTLYIDYVELFDNDNDNYLNSFSATPYFSISPPYEIITSGREKIEIDKKNVWTFNDLFNSLDCIGGINLIIHLVAEVLLKFQKYQNETLSFLSILLNRFPFIHDFFVENSVYELFSCLVDSHLNFKSLFLYENKHITNSKIIQCFLSKNRPSKLVIQNLINSSSGSHNNKFLNTTQLFNMIIMTLNDFNEADANHFCEFALKLTVSNNFFEHSTFVFICLLYNHLDYSNFINEKFVNKAKDINQINMINETNTILLIKLFTKLLPNPNIHIEALIPVLLNDDLSDDIKIELLDLLINNTTMNYYEYLSFAIQNMKCDSKKMYDYAYNSSSLNVTLIFPFFMVQAAAKSEMANERLESLCSRFSLLLNEFSVDLFNQHFLLLQCPYSSNFFLTYKKKSATSLLMYVAVFLVKSIDNNPDDNTFKLIINFFYLLQNLKFENENEKQANDEPLSISMSFSLLAILFFSLRTSVYLLNNVIILFGLSFGEFLLSQVDLLSRYAIFFIKEILNFILKISNSISHEHQSVINQTYKFISFLTSNPNFVFNKKMLKLIESVEEFAKSKKKSSFMNIFFSGHSNSSTEANTKQGQEIKPFIFQRNKYYVKASIQALPLTIPSVSVKSRKSSMISIDLFESNKGNNVEDTNSNETEISIDTGRNWNWSNFIECCLLYYHSLKSEVIDQYYQEESFDKIFETWKSVFYSLQIPSSHIYDSCPTKYTISDSSNKIEIRRLLFPMNPSFDSCFLSYWREKYHENEPKIRLTFKEILKPYMFSHSQLMKNAKVFKATWFYRISMIKGFILVTGHKIKFYKKKEQDEMMISFLFKHVKNIRQMFNQHEKKGILIEDDCFRNFSFAFKTESDCEDFLASVSHHVKIVRTFENENLIEKQKKWISNEISNFDYLIYLNKFSGRTWCDFTQYPFFPWVITKYESKKHKKKQKKAKFSQENNTNDQAQINSTDDQVQAYITDKQVQLNNSENQSNVPDRQIQTNNNGNQTQLNITDNQVQTNKEHQTQLDSLDNQEQTNNECKQTQLNDSKNQLQANIIDNQTPSESSRNVPLADSFDKLDLHDLSIYRDLSYQLFAQTEAHRKCCSDYYEVTQEMNNKGSHFPNYVSNVGSAIYYLVRLEPFITEEMLFQGGRYDSPDRMFQSFDITSKIMLGINTKSSLEFVPEVYYLPEMYKNVNSLVFPRSSLDPEIDLEHFTLPSWSKSAEDLVYKMRKALESPYVSSFLHEWINLIWGVKRTGDLAFKSTNVFPELVFKFNKETCQGDKLMMRGIVSEIHNCGTAPEQLFHELHPQRFVPVVSDSPKDQANSNSIGSSPGKRAAISSARSMSSLAQISSTNQQKGISRFSSSSSLQGYSMNLNDEKGKSARCSFFDINSHFLFFEQRESRLQFVGIRSPMAKEIYSLKFDKDWLIIPPIHKIRINRKGVLELVRRNSTMPALKYRFGQTIRPIFISKSGSDIVTSHQTPIIAHWRLSMTSHAKTRTESREKSQTKLIASSSSSSSILASLNSDSNFNMNLSATSSSSLSNSSGRKNASSMLTPVASSSSLLAAPASPSTKVVTFENDGYNGESCLKLESVLRGYSVNITAVFISTTSFVILAGHEDGCVSVFSMSPHRFLRLIQIENDQKPLKYPITMVRTANWNSDIIVFQERKANEGQIEIGVTPTYQTDSVNLNLKRNDSENSSMMNKLVSSMKSKFQRGSKLYKDDVKLATKGENRNKSGILTFISLYSVNGVFHNSICLNHRVKECCGTSYPYATKKNYFALLTEEQCIVLLNGRNLQVVQVYDISECPAVETIIYNKLNDSLILTTKTREIIDFNMVPVSSSCG